MKGEMVAGEKERQVVLWALKHTAPKRTLINEIAEWMAAEVKDRGKLDHHEAANAIRKRRPHDVMLWKLIVEARERNDRDGSIREVCRFSPPVLEAFRKLTGNTVRWGKKDRYWVDSSRKREAPTRLQQWTTQRD
jgi:hypothetical protein